PCSEGRGRVKLRPLCRRSRRGRGYERLRYLWTCLALAGPRAGQRPTDVSQLSQNGWVLSHNGDARCGFSEAALLSASLPEAHRRTRMSTPSPTRPQAIPGWLIATLICGTFATLLWLEHRRPLRRQTERKLTRNVRNLAMVGLSATTIWLTE